ncbi:DUF5753 domain-containing protein [Micromonospora parva]|uniref:DUF5753 domain-containing protein n=1 Tax=Micromonospora parva TaxID=1464048 RepID=UPI003665A1B3
MRWYQPEVIPGVLQVEPYIRTIDAIAHPRPPTDEVDRQVAVRMERQSILRQDDGPDLSFIPSESALRRSVGDATTMRDQLLHLAEVSQQPNVTLQVFPVQRTDLRDGIVQLHHSALRGRRGNGRDLRRDVHRRRLP